MASIKVYRKWTRWDTDEDGVSYDEPETVREEEESYPIELDAIDRSEGLTVIDAAVLILERTLYVTDTSSYPGWQRNQWYSANGDADEYEMRYYNADHWELTAHLEGFNDDEELAIFRDLSKRNPHWR
jgi:hypothetical protein